MILQLVLVPKLVRDVAIADRGNALGTCTARKGAHQLDQEPGVLLLVLAHVCVVDRTLAIECPSALQRNRACRRQIPTIWGQSCRGVVLFSKIPGSLDIDRP